jgi:AcrR family transcriptional regulator
MSTAPPAPSPAPSAARPGRQRSEACDALLLETTLQLLGEAGYAGFTVASVIERAGVSSATLYRRWPTKPELVAAAVATLVPEPVDTDTGSLAGDLLVFVQHIADSMAARREDVYDALTIEKHRNPELAALLRERFLAPRLADLRGILQRAKRRGELTTVPSTEVALSLVVGPLHHRGSSLGEPLTPAFVRTMATYAARALGA